MVKKLIALISDYTFLTLGVLVYCMGWTSFIIPNGMISGGFTGLCTVINYATGGLIPIYLSYFVLNILLIVIAVLILGKSFGFKTIYAIVMASVFFKILELSFFDFMRIDLDDKLILALLGGLFGAIGIGTVILRGGSTGGTDIIAIIINKYWPVSTGKVFLYLDLFIIASILLVPGKTIEDMIYGYVNMFTFSFVVDQVILGRKSSVQLFIFSSKYEELADYIVKSLDRGVTALSSTGWYSKYEGKVLFIVAKKNQVHNIVKEIKQIDSNAFISISPANSVYGNGFDEVKTGFTKQTLTPKNEDAPV